MWQQVRDVGRRTADHQLRPSSSAKDRARTSYNTQSCVDVWTLIFDKLCSCAMTLVPTICSPKSQCGNYKLNVDVLEGLQTSLMSYGAGLVVWLWPSAGLGTCTCPCDKAAEHERHKHPALSSGRLAPMLGRLSIQRVVNQRDGASGTAAYLESEL